MVDLDWSRWPNFSAEELACQCGCGKADMDPAFMDRLQAIRTAYGKPMRITSGFRCEAHNAALGGGPEHPMGKAVDVGCENPDARELVGAAVAEGMPRIGVSQRGGRPRFIHIGGSHDLPTAIWSY